MLNYYSNSISESEKLKAKSVIHRKSEGYTPSKEDTRQSEYGDTVIVWLTSDMGVRWKCI